MKITQELVTPEYAEDLLSLNYEGQRKAPDKNVLKYAHDMESGQWNEDIVAPIMITDNGELINGQHRLLAVIKSGVPIKFYIARGGDKNMFPYIDQGFTREAKDFYRGPNATTVTALARLVYALDAGSSPTEALNAHVYRIEDGRKKLSPASRQDILQCLENYEDELQTCIRLAQRTRKAVGGGAIAVFGFAFYLIRNTGGNPEPFVDDLAGDMISLTTRSLVKTFAREWATHTHRQNYKPYYAGLILMADNAFESKRERKTFPEAGKYLERHNDFYARARHAPEWAIDVLPFDEDEFRTEA